LAYLPARPLSPAFGLQLQEFSAYVFVEMNAVAPRQPLNRAFDVAESTFVIRCPVITKVAKVTAHKDIRTLVAGLIAEIANEILGFFMKFRIGTPDESATAALINTVDTVFKAAFLVIFSCTELVCNLCDVY
jgi:hypothetical protein